MLRSWIPPAAKHPRAWKAIATAAGILAEVHRVLVRVEAQHSLFQIYSQRRTEHDWQGWNHLSLSVMSRPAMGPAFAAMQAG